ncbi:MAG: hypothetical protein U9N46_01040 [Euryarchaeota archaeon]|nr:hypothetical protein [Euryarchaeota archaeon]
MPDKRYNWKRFWHPMTCNIDLSDRGYLYDPDSEYGHIHNPDLVPFESIETVPCLVLLGEPGIGKTRTMDAERNAIDARVKQKGGQTLWLDLQSYGSEDRLVRELFGNPKFISWRTGTHRLHVFLDSLDECLLEIRKLATLLPDEFKKYPVERLYLRIACRTADLPNVLEEGLEELWGKDAVGVYELTPLRRVDVIEAAKANNLNADAFLQEIDRMEAVPLAIKPITLKFLLNTYLKGKLRSTQDELYLKGCRLLCEETNESHRAAKRAGEFTADERMAVAARIAAVTIFANRYAIWTDVDTGDVPGEDVTVRELCGGSESVNDDEIQVSEATVRETLATGLFSSRGPKRMGWAHQTYAEFFAAQYLVQRGMTLSQMMSLITHPDGKLVPQLYETAAWLACMAPEVFQEIMKMDPEVLLRSDVATADTKDRAALVESLLILYDKEKSFDHDWAIRGQYQKLAHPELAEQLRSYICDVAKNDVVRRVAINIAEACELQTLQGDLVDIALDPAQPAPIREAAAYAAVHIGDDTTKAKLKPLAIGESENDHKDQLKGYGLQAVWPDHITAKELFTVLTHPKVENFYGAYWAFFSSKLVQHLGPTDLLTALKWVEGQPTRDKLTHHFEQLMDDIMLKAWEHLESPDVQEAFAKSVLSRFKHYDKIVGGLVEPQFESMLGDDEKRRRAIDAIVPMLPDRGMCLVQLVDPETPWVIEKDIPWMIERIQCEESQDVQRVWAELIERVFDRQDPNQFDTIFTARQKSPVLAEEFAWLPEPVELNSPRAQEMKVHHSKIQEWANRANDRPILDPPPAKRIAFLLDECESGNLSAWWRLNMEMTLEPDSALYRDELKSDLTVLPGWKAADATTKARIVETAKRYVLEQDPKTQEWLGTNTMPPLAFAGYRALILLLREAPDFTPTIPTDVWKKWTPTILAYLKPHHELVKLAYEHAPDDIIRALLVIIDKQNEEHDYIFITRKVECCWDDRLADALLKKAKDAKLKPVCMGSLLVDLLDHNVDEAKVFAESLVPLPLPSSEDARNRAIAAARALMFHAKDAGWSVVGPAIREDTKFGREVISAVTHNAESIEKRLTDDQLADLYVWLVRQYPHAEDPKHDGACIMEPRDRVTNWRNSILSYLRERGTHQACDVIQRISHELPELDWLKWTLWEAQNNTRRCTGVPPQLADILEMADDSQKCLVNSGDQLLDVLIESLKRLEEALQGETPSARDIWDQDRVDKKRYRPIDENGFSDYVKRHLEGDLKQRGIIVNREVEIRRGEGSGKGERTDIYIAAVVRGSNGKNHDSVSVIIEVKGCWNKELDTAMKTQLVDRYLKDNPCQHGMYLVGWFNCDQWDDEDYRKKGCPKRSIDEAQNRFDIQAADLSQQDVRIKVFVMNTALR